MRFVAMSELATGAVTPREDGAIARKGERPLVASRDRTYRLILQRLDETRLKLRGARAMAKLSKRASPPRQHSPFAGQRE
mmetsp:Transcript_37082/g.50286  ORF Transcript_37082/g.50286 Transcript_37082/m.50286 type:complete len:80 (-) Transcript_37082:197-436(-)|eukprot:scaffold303204_cov37-Tisochrysis_lutea.AAC.2